MPASDTTRPASPARDALLLNKIAVTPFGWHTTEATHLSVLMERLENDGFVKVNRLSTLTRGAVLTAKGERAARTANPAALFTASTPHERAQRALWAWLLHNGFQPGSYAAEYELGQHGEIAHLLACGLELAYSSVVRDDVWTVWAGTFADDNREAGVSGQGSCACGEIRNFTVHARVESITALLTQVLAQP